MAKVEELLNKYRLKPNPLKDQFFLADEKIIARIIKVADLKRNERIIEVGPGLGFLTKALAKKVSHLLAIEIDPQFKPILATLPSSVEVVYDNAWEFLGGPHQPKIFFDKLISNLPYSLCEPLMHKFTHGPNFKMILFVIPKKFFFKILNHPIFGAFYQIEKVFDIPKTAFYPIPKSNAVLVKIQRTGDPLKTKNFPLFIRRYLYEHEQALVKNSLMEAMIRIFFRVYNQSLTKNQARELVKKADINQDLLGRRPDSEEIYFEAAEKIEKILKPS